MNQTAVNYGIVLYELGTQAEAVNSAKKAIKSVPKLKEALNSPLISRGKKHRIVERIFPKGLHSFLKQLCDSQRFSEIEEIFQAYDMYAAKKNGIVTASLCYVVPPSAGQLEKIADFVKRKYQCREVKFILQAEPALLGGFILRIGSYEYDRSLRGRFMRMKQKLEWREK